MQVHRKCWQGIIILLQLLLIYGQNQIRDESTTERQPMQHPISALVQWSVRMQDLLFGTEDQRGLEYVILTVTLRPIRSEC